MTSDAVDVAVVGGGPAGSLTAMLLAGLGHEVVLLERAPAWRWRACGVFSSPAGVAALRRLGVAEADLARVARPLRAMRVETRRGTRFGLTYGGSSALADSAVGFDREALDPHLLALARAAGADVREGAAAARLALDAPPGPASLTLAGGDAIRARVVVGADGIRSLVARTAGVARRTALGPRAALTFHLPDPGWGPGARMVVIEDGYVGLAPVPRDRLNVGIVLGRSWFGALRREGAGPVARGILARLPDVAPEGRDGVEPLDRVAGTTPLGHAVARRAGADWLLVGDAAGFLDPFTGEGLHRAIVSAELAAEVVDAVLAGRPRISLVDYDRAMRERFATKDLVSRVVQAFLGRPALFEYAARRLAARERVRETMGLVIGDLAPASRVLDPRYLAALLAP
jgi:flavin-dependent dehydrogenase